MEAEALSQILTLVGSTSPLVAVLAWYLYNQKRQFDRFEDKQDSFTGALHDVDKRLAVIENYVELTTKKGV